MARLRFIPGGRARLEDTLVKIGGTFGRPDIDAAFRAALDAPSDETLGRLPFELREVVRDVLVPEDATADEVAKRVLALVGL